MKTFSVSLALFIGVLLAGCASTAEKPSGYACNAMAAQLATKRRTVANVKMNCSGMAQLPSHE